MRKSNFALRLQPSLLDEARKLAVAEGVALNQLINVALAEKLSALRTAEHFTERAARADIPGALANLSQALDQSLTVRSELGGRLAEIETPKGVTEAAGLEHQRRQSELQDLDYAEASTRLARQQVALEAAQQSFARIARLSLFNYLT